MRVISASIGAALRKRPPEEASTSGRGHSVFVLLFSLALTACATAPKQEANHDPFEPANRKIYWFNREVDRFVFKPVADAYTFVTPNVVQTGVTNFYQNLVDVNIAVNGFLQGKFKQGFSDTTRILVNSTLGLLGFFDFASGMGFEKHNEDFGQTLAVWGVPEGPYLVLPFFGPYTARDTPGLAVDAVTNPFFYVPNNTIVIPVGAVGVVDVRARNEGAIKFVDEAALDPYAFTREAYLQRRAYLIHDGNPPTPDLFDEEFDETPGDEQLEDSIFDVD